MLFHFKDDTYIFPFLVGYTKYLVSFPVVYIGAWPERKTRE